MATLAEAIRWRWVRRTLLFAAVVGMGLWAWTRNPLPSDEAMIAFFHEHRADLEELVRRYRRFEPGPNQSHNLWLKQGDTPELLKRAEVYNIDHSATGYPWYPNPYSVETGKLVEDDKSGLARWHKYGALIIKPAPRGRYYAFTLHRAVVWKDFVFFPEVPRIENGELLGPMESNGRYSFRKRVLPSLNRFPITWRSFECVYRRIEPQWFLCMCNGH